MKKLIILSGLLLSTSSYADMSAEFMKQMEPKTEEVSKSRACFQELDVLGCRHPNEDQQHFRSCMSDMFSKLSPDCKRQMSSLYSP